MRFIFMLAMTVVVALAAPVAAWSMTFDEAVDQLVADGYPQGLEDYLTSQGTSPIGFALGGSSAETNRAIYLAAELRALGFQNVRLEPVPLDVQEFKGASVTVGSRVMTASTFGGVPGTPAGGITADVVYVHGGTAADFAAAGDVSGKLVLIDELLGSYWMNWPWVEANLNGAAGIIYCGFAGDDTYYAEPDALGAFDAEYLYDMVPAVYISEMDADWLKAEMDGGPVCATMVNDQEFTLACDGGVGYNVVGTLPGARKGAGRIIITAHKDSYFHAGVDDLGGVVGGMLFAKALKMSGYKSDRAITFLFTTGEEYGRVNSYYDWCIGSWHFITQRHPNWAGKTAALLSLDGPGMKDAILRARPTHELKSVLEQTIAENPTLVPNGHELFNVNCWNDAWTFTAAGIPSIDFRERTPYFQQNWYHTQYDTKELMDWPSLARFDKFLMQVVSKLDKGVLPYDLPARADSLAGVLEGDVLKDAGADATAVDRVVCAVETFAAEAAAYEARSTSFKANKVNGRHGINKRLMAIEKKIHKAFTALDSWDSTVYPHEQVLYDIQQLQAALAALEPPVDEAAALEALSSVGYTGAGLDFSHENYLMQLAMKQPGWWGGLFWGEQGHLSPLLDVRPTMADIESGDYDAAKATLESFTASEVEELNARLSAISDALDWVNSRLPRVK